MKRTALRLPIGLVPHHAAFLLGACIVSSADMEHINMLSRHMPDIAYTPANFAAWDGWTKAYAIVTVLAAVLCIVWRCIERMPLYALYDLALIAAAGLGGAGIGALWGFASDALPLLAMPLEILFMIARWTWLPHTLGVPVLLLYRRRDEKKRDKWGHSSQL